MENEKEEADYHRSCLRSFPSSQAFVFVLCLLNPSFKVPCFRCFFNPCLCLTSPLLSRVARSRILLLSFASPQPTREYFALWTNKIKMKLISVRWCRHV